jgi:hypothetical protein
MKSKSASCVGHLLVNPAIPLVLWLYLPCQLAALVVVPAGFGPFAAEEEPLLSPHLSLGLRLELELELELELGLRLELELMQAL